MHLDDGRLQALADGELAAAEESEARRHLAACADCRTRLAEAAGQDAWTWAQLRQLDHAMPAADVAAVVARAGRGAALRRWGRRAAGIAVAVAVAGTAWAVPGSPVRGWVQRLAGHAAVGEGGPSAAAGTGGIAVDPGERLTIVLPGSPPAGSVVVSLSDRPAVEVRCPEGTARFTADVDRLVIDLSGPGAVCTIVVPRRAPWVAVVVRGERVFAKNGDRIAAAGAPDSAGRYVLPLN